MTAANAWGEWPCLGFDLETTGVNPLEAWPVTVALVRTRPDGPADVYSWLVRPDGWEIPDEAAEIHGVTTAQALKHGLPIDTVLAEVTDKLETWLARRFPVAAMNAAYDFTVLEATTLRRACADQSTPVVPLSERLGGRRLVAPILDPFVLDKYADPYRKGSRKLVDMAAHYGISLGDDAHNAAADALAACRLWPRIISTNPRKFPGHTLKSLHLAQVGWRRAQCDSLRAYFDKQGTEHDGVDPGWPYLSTLPEPATSRSHQP